MRSPLKRLLLILLLLSPAMAWALYKPIRVLAPALVAGVSCPTENLCIDDVARQQEAERLYASAERFIESEISAFDKPPRVVFCSTATCYQSFGFGQSAGKTVGVSGIVIAPRGWTEVYLRHEMIHHLQAERLGLYRQWRSPVWFKEGMAYALSGDPRSELTEPWEGYRARFNAWYGEVGNVRMWEAAADL